MFDSRREALNELRKIDEDIVPGGYKINMKDSGTIFVGGFSVGNYAKKQYGREYLQKF